MNTKRFFDWCSGKGYVTNLQIADALNISTQTVRNWKRLDDDARLPIWVLYACEAIDTEIKVDSMDIDSFKSWQKTHDLLTYESTGGVFGISRQAVHQWFRRGRFPKWISLACAGFSMSHK